ncbi:MAG: hypothetical protein JNL98_35855 [Bryobacterales bacterium]|nr:hypothetical protein [Bryobacterales bacterium]
MLEFGEPAIAISEERLRLENRGRWLSFEAWEEDRFLSRRIVRVKSQTRDRLELVAERFGGRESILTLFDAARPANGGIQEKGKRQAFGAVFRRMLQREFPGFRIAEESTEANLQESLSPAYPRALLRQGTAAIAVIAAPPNSDVDAVLSFGLIWLDYLRAREQRISGGRAAHVQGLAIFVPQGHAQVTALRMCWLDANAAQWTLFEYSKSGHCSKVDYTDCGNLDTHVEPLAAGASSVGALEPEAVIEEQIRGQLRQIEADLHAEPVYGQVPAFAGCDRGIVDLLGVSLGGRLTILELKATESIHLPLQALDYWIRVRWHLERGDFQRHGYFPGIALSPQLPKLLLVAPAMRFHSTNERILRYLDPRIEVERVGIAPGWVGPVRVLFREPRGPNGEAPQRGIAKR